MYDEEFRRAVLDIKAAADSVAGSKNSADRLAAAFTCHEEALRGFNKLGHGADPSRVRLVAALVRWRDRANERLEGPQLAALLQDILQEVNWFVALYT